MNDEQLASALSAHIDAVLAGQPTPVEDGPQELVQLLVLADQLAASDVSPRPAFGQRLKRSLLDRQGGGSGGSAGLGGPPWLVILGLVVVMGIIGMGAITANLAVKHLLPQRTPLPTSTPDMLSPITTLMPTIAPVTPTPTRTPAATTRPVDTAQPTPASATDRLAPTASPAPDFPLDLVPHPAGSNHAGDSGGDSDDDDDDDDDDD